MAALSVLLVAESKSEGHVVRVYKGGKKYQICIERQISRLRDYLPLEDTHCKRQQVGGPATHIYKQNKTAEFGSLILLQLISSTISTDEAQS